MSVSPSPPPVDAEPSAPSPQPAEEGLVVGIARYLVGLGCRMSILFGFYVLSIGPMYWPWYSGTYGNGSEFVSKLYLPLWVLCVKFPWFGDWVDRYVWMWNEWGR